MKIKTYGKQNGVDLKRRMLHKLSTYVKKNSTLVDMGCGENWVKTTPIGKKCIVTGFDPFDANADVVAKIDINDNWVKEHQSYFDVGVALHSLHFGDTKTVLNNITIAMGLLKKHSYCYLSINQDRVDDREGFITVDYRKTHNDWFRKINELFHIEANHLITGEKKEFPTGRWKTKFPNGHYGSHHFIIQRG